MTSTELQCLESGPECEGAVEFRMPLSGTGRAFPRCEHHWDKRLDTQERDNQRYPDSPAAPAWYDAAAIGEHWDEDY
ncbi:MAG: hypothetical protein ACJ780_10280 [Solirubrobacteraceae bacterium]|jgi:hypothetical protein